MKAAFISPAILLLLCAAARTAAGGPPVGVALIATGGCYQRIQNAVVYETMRRRMVVANALGPEHVRVVDGGAQAEARGGPAVDSAVTQQVIVAAPLAVNIEAPTVVPIGEMVRLRAAVTGELSACTWKVLPASKGLVMLDGGTTAVFTDKEPGRYVFLVAVAGNGGQVAQDVVEVEIVAQSPPPVEAAPAVIRQQVQPQAQAAPKSPIDVMVSWAGEVNSSYRGVEARALAGSFRSVASQKATGTLAANADPLEAAFVQCKVALGARIGPWAVWFDKLRDLASELKEQGLLQSTEQWTAFLANASASLERVR